MPQGCVQLGVLREDLGFLQIQRGSTMLASADPHHLSLLPSVSVCESRDGVSLVELCAAPCGWCGRRLWSSLLGEAHRERRRERSKAQICLARSSSQPVLGPPVAQPVQGLFLLLPAPCRTCQRDARWGAGCGGCVQAVAVRPSPSFPSAKL